MWNSKRIKSACAQMKRLWRTQFMAKWRASSGILFMAVLIIALRVYRLPNHQLDVCVLERPKNPNHGRRYGAVRVNISSHVNTILYWSKCRAVRIASIWMCSQKRWAPVYGFLNTAYTKIFHGLVLIYNMFDHQIFFAAPSSKANARIGLDLWWGFSNGRSVPRYV